MERNYILTCILKQNLKNNFDKLFVPFRFVKDKAFTSFAN